MSATRLMILCYFYPPLAGGGVHRVLSFTRHLPALGWSCTVVCAGAEDYWVRDETLAATIPPETEILRVQGGSAMSAWMRGGGAGGGRRSGSTFGALRRLADWWLLPDSYVGWARRARAVATRRAARGDISVLLSSSPPDSVHLAALGVARATGLPWVVDFRDPWVPLYFRSPPTAWHRARQQRMERQVLERADRVTAASRVHADALRAALGPERAARVDHLPNGYQPVEATAASGARPASDHFEVVFTGTLALMPDTETLLEAVHEVLAHRPEARRRLRVRLIGPFEVGYRDRAVALGLTGIVEFLGPRPHDETRAWQRRADLLVLWKPRGPGYRTMVPGKLYEYLESGRPWIALLDPADEATALATRAGAPVIAPGDVAALTAEIDRRYAAWRAGGRVEEARPPEWLVEHHRAPLAARLAATLTRAREAGR